MKRLKTIGNFYSGNKFSIIFIAVIFTFLLLFFVLRLGGVSPYIESLKLYESANLDHSIYYMPSRELETNEQENYDDEISQYPAVKDIATEKINWMSRDNKETDGINALFYNDAMLDAFKNLQDEGKWLTDLTDEEKETDICIVVCGYWFRDVKVGDIINLKAWENEQFVPVRVVGKCNNVDTILPALGASKLDINTSDMFDKSNNSIIVHQKDAVKLLGHEPTYDAYGSFIRLKETATTEDISELKDFLAMHGGYSTCEDILTETHIRYQDSLRSELAIPLLLLFIALYAFVSIFVLTLNRKVIEMRSYFLCGYSKRRCFVDFFVSMLLVILIPCIPCTLVVLQTPPAFTEFLLYIVWGGSDNQVINIGLLPYLGGYLLICIVLALALSIQFIKKSSVIELYRRSI